MQDITCIIQASERSHVQIERQLRALIQQGELAPGERLPATQQMAKQWKVSSTTVHRALAHLTAAGLLERRPCVGTFVRPATDRAVIGLLLVTNLNDETAYFYRAVLNALETQMAEKQWAGRVYHDLRPEDETEFGRAQRRHLTEDLGNYRFRGLIEIGMQARILPEIRFDPALPKVCLLLDKARADIVIDQYDFGHAAAEYVARAGRRQILYLRNDISREGADLDGIWDVVHERGLPKPRVETLHALGGHDLEQAAFQKMLALIREWPNATGGNAPEALIVADDIAMRGAALALVERRVPVPRRLLVVSHANQGIKLHYGIPVVRYEYSPGAIARCALDLLGKRLAGEPLPALPLSVPGRMEGVENRPMSKQKQTSTNVENKKGPRE